MDARRFVCALLAAIVLPAFSAGVNPRDAPPRPNHVVPEPVTDPAQIGAWLRRLAGSYRVDGIADVMERLETVKGAADCVGVGNGPGVQCILNVHWEDLFEIIMPSADAPLDATAGVFNLPGGASFLNPAMALFGVDPGKAGMTFMLVDNKGLPEGGAGLIAGDRATFRSPCVNARALYLSMNPDRRFNERYPDTCERIIFIDARPDARLVNLSMHIKINDDLVSRFEMTMRRAR